MQSDETYLLPHWEISIIGNYDLQGYDEFYIQDDPTKKYKTIEEVVSVIGERISSQGSVYQKKIPVIHFTPMSEEPQEQTMYPLFVESQEEIIKSLTEKLVDASLSGKKVTILLI